MIKRGEIQRKNRRLDDSGVSTAALCNFCLPGSGKDADSRAGRMRTPVDSQAMQRNTKSVLLGEPANRAANACHGKAEGIKDSDGGRISACLRTFCRLALRFGWGRSEDRVCCLWLCRRRLRATVARACPVATARPCRCCCKTYDVHVPKIGQGTRNLRPRSSRCAAEVAAGASFLDRHVSNGPRTPAGDSMHSENDAAGVGGAQLALVRGRSCT